MSKLKNISREIEREFIDKHDYRGAFALCFYDIGFIKSRIRVIVQQSLPTMPESFASDFLRAGGGTARVGGFLIQNGTIP